MQGDYPRSIQRLIEEAETATGLFEDPIGYVNAIESVLKNMPDEFQRSEIVEGYNGDALNGLILTLDSIIKLRLGNSYSETERVKALAVRLEMYRRFKDILVMMGPENWQLIMHGNMILNVHLIETTGMDNFMKLQNLLKEIEQVSITILNQAYLPHVQTKM